MKVEKKITFQNRVYLFRDRSRKELMKIRIA